MWIELLASIAWAGACCSGSTTTTPAQLARCEHASVAITTAADQSIGRWDQHGKLMNASPGEQAIVPKLAGAWRLSRTAQLGVELPTVWTRHEAGGLVETGGGLGDMTIGATWEPVEEDGGPVPILALGARFPTGRSWKDATSPLLADVTGLAGPGLRIAGGVERTTSRTPWSIGSAFEIGPAEPVTWSLAGAIGRTLGSDWSLGAGLRYGGTLAGSGTRRPTVSVQVVRGERLAWRTWAGIAADLPIAGLGISETAEASAQIGFAIVR